VIHRNLQPSDGYSLRLDFVLEFYSKPRIFELPIMFRSRSIGIQPDEAEDDNFVAMRKECSTKNNTPLYSVGQRVQGAGWRKRRAYAGSSRRKDYGEPSTTR
jgi:hypothetical protein